MSDDNSTTKPLPQISAVLLAADDADGIAAVIQAVHQAMETVARSHELIVVLRPGSDDGTDRLVQQLAHHDEQLRVETAARPGYGAALRAGLAAARFSYVFLSDADGQYDPGQIQRLVPLIEGHDMVVGYRKNRQDPLARRVTALAYNRLVDLALGTGVRDVDCAFKLFRRQLLADINLTSQGGLLDPELVARVRAAGRRIAEVEVAHRTGGPARGRFDADGGGSLPRPSVVAGVLGELWRLRGRMRKEARDSGDAGHQL